MSENADPLAPRDDETDLRFEPVIRLTERVDTKTNEEDEEVLFEREARLFRFDVEWKERGTGTVRLLAHKETKKVRLVMRRKTILKVCANHLISPEMELRSFANELEPNQRSWVWKVAADYSESPPTAETLAIRFKTPEDAGEFKKAFDEAKVSNAALAGGAAPAPATEKEAEAETKEETKEETQEETKEETKEEAEKKD
ncbi:hypothetical protein H0H87_011735 [Tephrocybe sp. NHM501043]|nr:hypothetical protein H0H87_011735 [Tephrocybe sp. NHM501043]